MNYSKNSNMISNSYLDRANRVPLNQLSNLMPRSDTMDQGPSTPEQESCKPRNQWCPTDEADYNPSTDESYDDLPNDEASEPFDDVQISNADIAKIQPQDNTVDPERKGDFLSLPRIRPTPNEVPFYARWYDEKSKAVRVVNIVEFTEMPDLRQIRTMNAEDMYMSLLLYVFKPYQQKIFDFLKKESQPNTIDFEKVWQEFAESEVQLAQQQERYASASAKHLVRPSGALHAKFGIMCHYPTFRTSHKENGETLDDTNPCMKHVKRKLGASVADAFVIDLFARREKPLPKALRGYRKSPITEYWSTQLFHHHRNFSVGLMDQVSAKAWALCGEPVRHNWKAKRNPRFQAKTMHDYLEGPPMSGMLIGKNVEMPTSGLAIQAFIELDDAGDIKRFYFTGGHPEVLYHTGKRIVHRCNMGAKFDDAINFAAVIAGCTLDWRYGEIDWARSLLRSREAPITADLNIYPEHLRQYVSTRIQSHLKTLNDSRRTSRKKLKALRTIYYESEQGEDSDYFSPVEDVGGMSAGQQAPYRKKKGILGSVELNVCSSDMSPTKRLQVDVFVDEAGNTTARTTERVDPSKALALQLLVELRQKEVDNQKALTWSELPGTVIASLMNYNVYSEADMSTSRQLWSKLSLVACIHKLMIQAENNPPSATSYVIGMAQTAVTEQKIPKGQRRPLQEISRNVQPRKSNLKLSVSSNAQKTSGFVRKRGAEEISHPQDLQISDSFIPGPDAKTLSALPEADEDEDDIPILQPQGMKNALMHLFHFANPNNPTERDHLVVKCGKCDSQRRDMRPQYDAQSRYIVRMRSCTGCGRRTYLGIENKKLKDAYFFPVDATVPFVKYNNVAMQHRRQEDRDNGDAGIARELKTRRQRTGVNSWEYQQEHAEEDQRQDTGDEPGLEPIVNITTSNDEQAPKEPNAANLRQISHVGKDNGISTATADADQSHPLRKAPITKRKATRKLAARPKANRKTNSGKMVASKYSHETVISDSYDSAEVYSENEPKKQRVKSIASRKGFSPVNKHNIDLEEGTAVSTENDIDDDIADDEDDDEDWLP